MSEPVICLGQQPCGAFPNRFVFAKIKTARRLRTELGGRIVFFLHDSDHDHRETNMALTNRHTGGIERINFDVVSKTQKLYSPLYCKTIEEGWKNKTLRCLPNLVASKWVEAFKAIDTDKVTEFCLAMYERMGLLDGLEIARSSDAGFREKAIDVDDHFVDTDYKGETVRARLQKGRLHLFKGGGRTIDLGERAFGKAQISPTRDTRLRWMQSVVKCTHYVAGEGEIQYLNQDDAPEIEFIKRDGIERAGEAYVECEHDW